MPIPQNGQTHSNSLSANCQHIECVSPFCEIDAERVNKLQDLGTILILQKRVLVKLSF